MTTVSTIRALHDALETVGMTTDELLDNARAAMRWRDEAGESPVEIFAEGLALRFWDALDTRLRAGEPIPTAWLHWPAPPVPAEASQR